MSALRKQQGILVKCGGFSTQLARNIKENIDADPLWGSRFDAKNPTAVIATHLEFLQNGAQIIMSNTYQASIEGFMEHLKLSKDESIQLMRKSVQLAKEAKAQYLQNQNAAADPDTDLPLIMASIGPYGAHLHDGSEYNGNYADEVSPEKIKSWHRPRIEACLAEGVDGLAVETIPCQMEAEAVVEMIIADYPEAKFWLSFQCKDEKTLAHGENFPDAVLAVWNKIQECKAEQRLYAIGVNCVNPKFVAPLFKSLHATVDDTSKIPLLVYSNRGETYIADSGWQGGEQCVPLESYVPEWVQLGAVIIGGCCRVYAEDIVNIRKCIDELGVNNN